ncbi:DivIVA domain-containing protein [Actinomyces oris]
MTILTSNDVDNVRFTATQFREGYEQHEVDSFLEKIASTLRVLQAGTNSTGYASNIAGGKVLTADDVQSMKFQGTRFREGYEQDEVDSFLDHVVETLRYLEGGAQASGYEAQWGGGSWDGAVNAYGSASYDAPSGIESSSSQAIAQRDQYIAQLQQENAYLRAELEAAQRRLEMFGA